MTNQKKSTVKWWELLGLALWVIILIVATYGCDSTKGEMIDGNEYAKPNPEITVSGMLKVGETITATYKVPGAATTLFKFDWTGVTNTYDESGITVTYTYRTPGQKVIYAIAKNEQQMFMDDCKKIIQIHE
jgi:fructose-1,6-bisphosphatase